MAAEEQGFDGVGRSLRQISSAGRHGLQLDFKNLWILNPSGRTLVPTAMMKKIRAGLTGSATMGLLVEANGLSSLLNSVEILYRFSITTGFAFFSLNIYCNSYILRLRDTFSC